MLQHFKTKAMNTSTMTQSKTESNTSSQKALKQFTLIDGDFTQKEAKDVLINLINYKIQFHNRKIFSTKERLGETDEVSANRLIELAETLKDLKALLNSLEEDANLIVSSKIDIEIK